MVEVIIFIVYILFVMAHFVVGVIYVISICHFSSFLTSGAIASAPLPEYQLFTTINTKVFHQATPPLILLECTQNACNIFYPFSCELKQG
jgi:hypothetical protein